MRLLRSRSSECGPEQAHSHSDLGVAERFGNARKSGRSELARDLPGTGSKTCERGVSGMTRRLVCDYCAADRPSAAHSKLTPTGISGHRSAGFAQFAWGYTQVAFEQAGEVGGGVQADGEADFQGRQ